MPTTAATLAQAAQEALLTDQQLRYIRESCTQRWRWADEVIYNFVRSAASHANRYLNALEGKL